MLAISEKVVLRVEDLITWITVDTEWTWGRLGKSVDTISNVKMENKTETAPPSTDGATDSLDIEKEKRALGKLFKSKDVLETHKTTMEIFKF